MYRSTAYMYVHNTRHIHTCLCTYVCRLHNTEIYEIYVTYIYRHVYTHTCSQTEDAKFIDIPLRTQGIMFKVHVTISELTHRMA